MNFINTIRKSKIRLALTSGVIACAIIFGGAYFMGLRVFVDTPGNYHSCSNSLDQAAGAVGKGTNISQQEFEKYCPNIFWGDWAITRPNGKGFDILFVGQFWRPYWGYIWPDNNIGFNAPAQKPKS